MESLSNSEGSGLFGKQKQSGNTGHNVASASMIAVAFVAFVITATFNGLAGSGKFPSIFYSTVGDLSDKYDLDITPAGFTFSIWSIIYLWIAAALVTLIATIFLSNSQGRVYQNPEFASPLLMGLMSVNFVFNLTWIFLWDREYIVAAAVVLALIAISNIAVVGLMARNIFKYKEEYAKGQPAFVWGIVYWVILNGFGIYTAWTVIASLINLTTALVYPADLDMTKCCLASLSLLVIFHTSYFILENTVFDKYLRFLMTPYIVVYWASNGIWSTFKDVGKEDVPKEIQDYVLAILIIAVITWVVRVALVIARTVKDKKCNVMSLEGCN